MLDFLTWLLGGGIDLLWFIVFGVPVAWFWFSKANKDPMLTKIEDMARERRSEELNKRP